jgi:glycosyltransferase involved in cell wall biosynthesis
MNDQAIKVCIVIPAFNAEDTVGLALSAALSQEHKCEVVVVDDGSTDSTSTIVKKYPSARYVRQENAGPANARNTGWKITDADVVLFTDSDCVPDKRWAKSLINGFFEDCIGAVTGSYDIANPEFLLPRLIHEEIQDRHHGYEQSVRFFGSYNVALRRQVLEETGGFDESYRRASGEDNDLSYRVLKAGYKIAFAPTALVAHHHTRSLKKYLREQYTHGYWRMKLYQAHPDMRGGDDYTRTKDIIEPPLSMATLISLLALPFFPWPFPALAVLLFALQVPAAVRITIRKQTASYLTLAPVTFLRGFARGIGMSFGFVRFFARGGR